MTCRFDSMRDIEEFAEAFCLSNPDEPVPLVNLDPIVDECANMLRYCSERLHTKAEEATGLEELYLVRLQLMVEELAEVMHAMTSLQMSDVLHELVDLNYVVQGTFVALGLEPYFRAAHEEVHAANMRKLDADGKPIINEAGRVVKPEGWRPADMLKVMARVDTAPGGRSHRETTLLAKQEAEATPEPIYRYRWVRLTESSGWEPAKDYGGDEPFHDPMDAHSLILREDVHEIGPYVMWPQEQAEARGGLLAVREWAMSRHVNVPNDVWDAVERGLGLGSWER